MSRRGVEDAGRRSHGRPGESTAVDPRVLLLDTSVNGGAGSSPAWDAVIDYRTCENVPSWCRRLEHEARLDFGLALEANRLAGQFDVFLAGSEKVGIPLALLGPRRPVVCVVHQIASPQKRRLLKRLDIPARWTRIAYQCEADRQLLASYYGVPEHRLLRFKAAPLKEFLPVNPPEDGFVLCVGTSKRDYTTLFAAVHHLPDVVTRIYASSKFDGSYDGGMPPLVAPWVQTSDPVPYSSMPDVYASCRFVVIAVGDSHQYSAGATVALEAHAAGRAVVATRTRGMPDYVIDGVTGILVPPGDPTALREAIARLWSDPALARTMGAGGRAHVERHFDPDVIDAEMRQACIGACEEFRRARRPRPGAVRMSSIAAWPAEFLGLMKKIIR